MRRGQARCRRVRSGCLSDSARAPSPPTRRCSRSLPCRARRARHSKLPPCLPDVEDQQVSADEEEHEGLDQQGEIPGKFGREELRVEGAWGGPREQAAEEERGNPASHRRIATEEG